MRYENRWLMPEGIEEILPPQAERVERLRREIINLFHVWGYELVMPPMIEYVESLLLGRGDDLDLQTFKLTDQLNGRLMGVRADITPQVARIDAHHLKRQGPARLCYVGSVLHARPDGFGGTREPIQVGAELYGHSGIESDVEVLQLMVETLAIGGVRRIHVDLGHVGIFRGLAGEAGLDAACESALFEALQRKSKPDMNSVFKEYGVAQRWQTLFTALVDLNGDAQVLEAARKLMGDVNEAVTSALDELQAVADKVRKRLPALPLYFDLAELRGYHYKTGIVFAAFVPGHGWELARGGRYDEVGREYGRARPATGFSLDLKTLLRVSDDGNRLAKAILAPNVEEPSLYAKVKELRARGERVIMSLPNIEQDPQELGCDRRLSNENGEWVVTAI